MCRPQFAYIIRSTVPRVVSAWSKHLPWLLLMPRGVPGSWHMSVGVSSTGFCFLLLELILLRVLPPSQGLGPFDVALRLWFGEAKWLRLAGSWRRARLVPMSVLSLPLARECGRVLSRSCLVWFGCVLTLAQRAGSGYFVCGPAFGRFLFRAFINCFRTIRSCSERQTCRSSRV